jgi:hypothetical protein
MPADASDSIRELGQLAGDQGAVDHPIPSRATRASHALLIRSYQGRSVSNVTRAEARQRAAALGSA